ncbi:MAG: protein-disulfide reductase DsbD domain-containing protein [Paracoccaceae bacterium]
MLDARLLPGWATDGGTHFAGLSVTLAPGWKTYWRSPGEAGIPPAFDWTGSENVASVRYHWPVPEVFHTSGMLSIGYHDGLLLPIEVTPVDAGEPIALRARVDIGVCDEICVPAVLEVSATLTQPGVGDPAIKAALRAVPMGAAAAGLQVLSCGVAPVDGGLRLTAEMTMPAIGRDETVVFETGLADVWVTDTVVMRSGGGLTAVVDLEGTGGGVVALDRSALVMTIIGDGRAVEVRGCPGE